MPTKYTQSVNYKTVYIILCNQEKYFILAGRETRILILNVWN